MRAIILMLLLIGTALLAAQQAPQCPRDTGGGRTVHCDQFDGGHDRTRGSIQAWPASTRKLTSTNAIANTSEHASITG